MIPHNISKESVLSALEEIKKNGIPENRHSDKYFLLHDNFLYPPKYVLTVANKFVNSKELDSTEFSGGAESNEFLERLGFNLVRKPADLVGQKWLAVVTPENWDICLQKGTFGGDENRVNQMKRIKSGDHLLVYVKGMKIAAICKVVKEYFYDDNKLVNDGIYPHKVGIEPIKKPKNTIDIKQVYDIYFRYKGDAAGYFGHTIRPLPDEEFSIFQSELARNMNELPKWNDDEPTKLFDIAKGNAKRVYLTAYPQANLEISKTAKLLGWKNKSSTMSVGDLVFVYNTTTRQIETGFEIKSKSQDSNAVWQDEKKDSEERPIYMNRWNAEIVQDDLNINLDDIYNFEPFKSNKKNFSVLLQNPFPTLLEGAKYSDFRNYLLDQSKVNELNPSEEKYFVLRWELDSKYQDEEGVYHFTTTVPRHSQIVPGVNVVFDRNVNGQIIFLGRGKVTEVKENKTENNTSNGREIVDKLAYLGNYEKFNPSIPRNREVEQLMQSIEGYNNQHSIRPVTREIYDLILQNNGWNFDIDSLSEAILKADPERELAIDTETVKRIILHLKAGKHVILSGPPGVGKTDLATRILQSVGSKITTSEERPYLEAVASDEWSRNETIGGLNLNNEFKEGWITKSVNQRKWLLIDEFNRANMNKAFGEMFLAIEYNRITLRPQEAEQFGKTTIVIPKDFRMICTMNDFDKNLLLTELSYGLISRFAVVGIVPDKDKEQEVVEKRIRSELNDSTNYDRCKEQIETYYKFINDVREKRLIGVRTSIDVVRFLVNGCDGNGDPDLNWKLLSYAFSDYILPQFDRLDREVIEHVLEASNRHLQHDSFVSFKQELKEANQRLEKATGWLLKNDD